jgi:hypothetical protein
MKVTLDQNISIKEDQIIIGKTQFDPSIIQNTLVIFHSRSFSRFRYLLEKLELKDLVIIMSFQNKQLNDRIWLHLSKESKTDLKVFMEFEAQFTDQEKEHIILLFDFEMMVG